MDSTIGRLRPGRPAEAAIVVVAALALAFAAWAVAGRTGGGSSSASISSPNLLAYLHRYAPTSALVERAFADHRVRLYRADAALLQPRFAPIRRYVMAMWRPAGAAHMLIVLLSRQPDRPWSASTRSSGRRV